jgi:prepilin-type N-terminal cleavage/methylation domain-containing protein
MANARQTRTARGFTLIEILVVISIIIILVGTVLAIGAQVRVKSQIHQTKVTLKALDSALKEYMATGGAEPADASTTDFVTKFNTIPACKRILGGLPGGGTVSDGFGNAIIYHQATSMSKPGYFQSNGPNGLPNDSDDIFSYEP